MLKNRFFGIFGTIVGSIENLIMPLDRARQVVLGTRMEHLEHAPRRIWDGFTIQLPEFL